MRHREGIAAYDNCLGFAAGRERQLQAQNTGLFLQEDLFLERDIEVANFAPTSPLHLPAG